MFRCVSFADVVLECFRYVRLACWPGVDNIPIRDIV